MPPSLATRTGWWLIAAAAAGLGLLLLFSLLGWTVEWLWMGELGYRPVFWTIRLTQLGLFVATLVPVFLYYWVNTRILVGIATSEEVAASPAAGWFSPAWAKVVTILAPGLGSLVFALSMAGEWNAFLRFRHGAGFGLADPVLGREVGFYVFTLPFLDIVQDIVVGIAVLALAAHLAVLLNLDLLRLWKTLGEDVRRPILRVLSANGAVFLVAWGWGYYLDRFRLLYTSDGTVFGPGYTDVSVVLPALGIMVGATFALIAVVAAGAYLNRAMLSLLGTASYLVLALVVQYAVPGLFQQLVVKPNELKLEEPYLRHNVTHTRMAFGLDRVKEKFYPAVTELSPAEIASNQDTINNVRLWDWRPLLQTYRQLQQLRLYYKFYDIDVDRYTIGGELRQVLLSARELSERLPRKAETWLNRTLQYTHGYGLAMSLATHDNLQGVPSLVVKDLPPVSAEGLAIERPAIYYGENMSGFKIVNTNLKEFDHPKGDANVYTRYQGRGGIRLSSTWLRLLLAWNRLDVNILISSYITEDSRIQMWREVAERVSVIAPFLKYDRDPYLVVDGGRLYWIVDAYTNSETFPYSEPFEGESNYIRNPVKVVVDAYQGSVAFYAIDPSDPVFAAYDKAFPGLFLPFSELSTGLRDHLRYPRDLFTAQVEMYRRYHMEIPQVFYNNEDLWELAEEKYGGRLAAMKPYYILMRLPGESRLQFLLMTPLTPDGRNNMIAWMAARSDFPGYGELIVYKFPKDRLIYGPLQIEALIDQDTLISRQLSLWDQRGSKVVRGNLIAIPIEHSLLYVEPVYLIAELNDVPQLKRVIVAHGENVVMEPTLEGALEVLFGGLPGAGDEAAAPLAPGTGMVSRLREEIQRAEQAMGNGDWAAFGAAMGELRRLLEDAR